MADEQTLPTDAELFQSTQVDPPAVVDPPATADPPAVVDPPVVTDPAAVKEPPAKDPSKDVEAAIPSWRLREEADRARAAEARATLLESRLNEVLSHIKQQPGEKKPDFFEDPDKATNEAIARALAPYAEETRATLLELGRVVASQLHGADKVETAEKAFLAAMNAKTLDVAEYEKVVTSRNRYDAVVQWHRRNTALATVGDDPAAWFQKQLEERMADPKFQAELLAKVQAGASAKPGAVVIPPSLSRSPGSAGNGVVAGSISDPDLFAHATSGMR